MEGDASNFFSAGRSKNSCVLAHASEITISSTPWFTIAKNPISVQASSISLAKISRSCELFLWKRPKSMSGIFGDVLRHRTDLFTLFFHVRTTIILYYFQVSATRWVDRILSLCRSKHGGFFDNFQRIWEEKSERERVNSVCKNFELKEWNFYWVYSLLVL